MSNDLVSIIIPIYNSENFLKESIESVLQQTWKNIEIIAVNDGSTDNSLKILENYHDKIQVINQKNSGLANALNNGIDHMSGKWFKWFSPDDILYPNAIETLVKTIKNLPEYTIVYSNWEIIDTNNKILRNFSEPNYNNLGNFDYNVRLLYRQIINVNSSLIPFSLIRNGCIFRDLSESVAIDYDFFLRAGMFYGVCFHLIPQILLQYRTHKKQLSHTKISTTLRYISNLKQEILQQHSEIKRTEYLDALSKYRHSQPISEKIMNMGLNILKSTALPVYVSDKILTLYLNKIRRTR